MVKRDGVILEKNPQWKLKIIQWKLKKGELEIEKRRLENPPMEIGKRKI